MKKLVNVSPLGDVFVVALGRVIPAGGTFDCPDAVAVDLLKQDTNFVESEAK